MGKFTYDTIVKADFEERVLQHLQAVIGAKVRRGESFHFSWKDDQSIGNGRTTVWIHPQCSLVYKFYSSTRQPLNPAWLKDLMHAANSASGLYVTPEPAMVNDTPEPVHETAAVQG